MNVLKSLVVRIVSALDYFWIGLVLRTYHQVQAERYCRKAARLAWTGTLRSNYAVVRREAQRHQAEAEMLGGKA